MLNIRFLKIDGAKIILEECGGVDKLEQLQNHKNENIYNRVLKLLEKHFEVDEVE